MRLAVRQTQHTETQVPSKGAFFCILYRSKRKRGMSACCGVKDHQLGWLEHCRYETLLHVNQHVFDVTKVPVEYRSQSLYFLLLSSGIAFGYFLATLHLVGATAFNGLVA